MKTTLLSLLLLFLIIAGCDDSTEPEDNSQMTISGKIENWDKGTDKIIRLYNVGYPYERYGQGTVSGDGSFSFKADPPSQLIAINNKFAVSPDCSDTIQATQKGVKVHEAYLEVVKGDTLFGHVFKELVGDTIYGGQYLYVDNDVSLTGTIQCAIPDLSIYDLNFVKGWNMHYYIYTLDNKYMKITTAEPKNMKFVLRF